MFPPTRGDRPGSLAKPWRQIRDEAGLPAAIGLHALRHSLATSMAMSGAEAVEIMTALGHRQLSPAPLRSRWKCADEYDRFASGGGRAHQFDQQRGDTR